MTDAPLPLVSPEVDLRDFPFMPLDVRRLLTSETWIEGADNPRAAHAALSLWCEAWHQVPAGSLPDNDKVLARLALCEPKVWRKVRVVVLRGFKKCSDGRLYHPVVCEKAREAWVEKLAYRERKAHRTEAARKAAAARWVEQSGEVSSAMRTASETHADGNADAMRDACETHCEGNADRNATAMPKGTGTGRKERIPLNPPEGKDGDIPAVPARPEFEALWQRYPRKVGKAAALKAWKGALKRATVAEIEAGLEQALPGFDAKDPQFVPHLSTWLNGDRWLDEPPAMVNGSLPSGLNGVAHSAAAAAVEVTPQIWQRRMEDFENHGSWRTEWGPRPDEAGCSAPGELLPGSVG